MTIVSVRQALRAVSFSLLTALTAAAATPQARITSAIDNTQRTALPGTLSPLARAANDMGAVPSATPLSAITLVFSRTPAQQAALDALTAAQQDPTSPQYHAFLTPAQFGAQFGAAPADIAATEAWLQQQGFTLEGVSRSSDRIFFAGTAAQVASSFGTELHNFSTSQGVRMAPSTELSLPTALASSVLTISNLSNFRPRSQVKLRNPASTVASPEFTSGQTGKIFLDPKDLQTIYDVNAAYSAGYNGAGQSIAVIGQSAIVASDITNFQTALGIPAKAPTQILVPNTGTSTVYTGDEAESDLDLEYSSAMAPGATVYLVYTGSSTNTGGVFTSLQYAVSNDIAPIITLSYGECEPDLGSSNYAQLNAILQQGAVQGQTIVVSAGDSGSTACDSDTTDTVAQMEAVAVDFPASSQYVTGMGGTEIAAANESSTYFNTTTGADIVSSAKSYVPEIVWNDDAYAVSLGATGASALSATGGGISTLTPRPAWQAGVPGIPTGSYRLLPDVSLVASNYYPGLLYCSSDTSVGVTGSCTTGFRDANNQYLTVAGGTSFDAPTFAGLVALINQAKNYTAGQGLINPTLYTLASNPTTYASAFHDISTGTNSCQAGTAYCSTAGASVYSAGTGYDEATGLGSVDFYNLLTAWPAASSSTTTLAPTTTTVAIANASPALGATDMVTVTVASASTTVTSTPGGTVSIYANGSLVVSGLMLSNGVLTYVYTAGTSGSTVIKAVYSGSTIYATSNGSNAINVGAVALSLTASNVTVTQGSSGTSTLVLTPSNGYTGTFQFLTIYAPSTLTNACVSNPANITITGTLPGSSSIIVYTNNSSCTANTVALTQGATGLFRNGVHVKVAMVGPSPALTPAPARAPEKRNPFGPATGIAAAGLLLTGFLGRRSRRLRSIVAVSLLVVAGFGISGCSNSSITAPPVTATSAAKGTYQITIAGADTVNTGATASANFTLTVQ
jgi:subtilase family serine protease